MNENTIDVLIYLYENYLDADVESAPDHILIQQELAQAGFPGNEIQKAFQWLDELAINQITQQQNKPTGSFRIFSNDECKRLDTDARGFILFLEQNGIIDQNSRELVLERVSALDLLDVSTEDLKWVVLLVLMNQPGGESQHALMEDLVFNSTPPYVH